MTAPPDSPAESLWHVVGEVEAEVERASMRFGPMTSSHEGLGVLMEEVAELVDAIRANKLESIRDEAIQVAAVAARIAAHCRGDDAFAKRSGAEGDGDGNTAKALVQGR